MVEVDMPEPLRPAVGGGCTVTAEGSTLRAVLGDLERRHPALVGRLLDERGQLRRYWLLVHNDLDAGPLDAPVRDGDRLAILPPLAGG